MDDDQLRTLHAEAVDAANLYVRRIDTADLARPTPCTGWSLGDLLAHMIGQHHGFAAAVSDGDAPRSAYAPVPFSQQAWTASVEKLLHAFAAASPTGQAVAAEIGPQPLPVRMLVGAQLLDTVVHTWDIAAALGERHEPSPALAAAVVEINAVVPDDDTRDVPGAAFARSVPYVGTPWEEALAHLGRDPRWHA